MTVSIDIQTYLNQEVLHKDLHAVANYIPIETIQQYMGVIIMIANISVHSMVI